MRSEQFVAEADLTEYDFSNMIPLRCELRHKNKAVSLRLSDALLDAVKRATEHQKIPYQRFMRQAIEQAVAAENGRRS
jgi:predicted DNA binding CopG/RHH family protein